MTSRSRTTRSSAVPVGPGGATLTEVLISILVMSVGVLSVMAMFPISILRSIQATQLTNAAILRQNAEDTIRALPQLARPPSNTAAGGWDGDIAGEWEPLTSYAVDDFVVPTVKLGSPLPNPPMRYRCSQAGTSGAIEPRFQLAGTTSEAGGSPQWVATPVNYVVDPLGWWTHQAADRDMFGSLPRLHADISSASIARQIMSLGDSYSTAVEEIAQSITDSSGSPPNTVTFPSTTNLGAVDTSFRVVVYTLDGEKSAVRNVAMAPSGQQVEMDTELPADILADISANGAGSVRIEAPEARYSWMLTVRHVTGSAKPEIYCVVLFNRSFSILDEFEYDADYSDPTEVIQVSWSGTDPEPLIREGNLLFDSENAIWYRMQTVNISGTTAEIRLETPPRSTSATGKAMFLPGIIDVFPVDL